MVAQLLDEANLLADRLAVIDHGRLIAEGTSRELKLSVGGNTPRLRIGSPDRTTEAQGLLQRALGGDLPTASSSFLIKCASCVEVVSFTVNFVRPEGAVPDGLCQIRGQAGHGRVASTLASRAHGWSRRFDNSERLIALADDYGFRFTPDTGIGEGVVEELPAVPAIGSIGPKQGSRGALDALTFPSIRPAEETP